MIPYGKQHITQDDVDAVLDVLNSDFLTQGPNVPLFEQCINEYCGSDYSAAVNSATSALHIACLALGLGKGDWLWTSPNTFVASANCALYCGASVDFVDIDSQTYNMSAWQLERKLIQAKSEDKLPKIVIPVHFAGQSCDMKRIHELSQEYNFHIIEDASHAIGASYLDQRVGNCRFSDITVFSFHPVKIITTAEGGIVTTNNEDLARSMALLRNHGITRDERLMTKPRDGSWYYQQIDLGFNYRMTELQAALGVSQMSRLDEYVEKRHALQARYHYLLQDLPITIPHQSKDAYSSLHLYPILLNSDLIEKSKEQVFNELRANEIGVNLHYIPVHLQPYYQDFGFKEGSFPVAEDYYRREISLPLYPQLTHGDQDYVVDVLKKVIG